jgi:hypothetical protein
MLALEASHGQSVGMKRVSRRADAPAARLGFPRLRKSHSGGQSLAAELSRLRKMSIEDRMIEALSIQADVSRLQPTAESA